MVRSPMCVNRLLCVVVALAFAGSVLGGCGGSSGVVPLNHGAKTPTSGNIHKLTVVRKSSIPSVMAKLIRAGAYYSPKKGQRPRLLRNLPHPQTPSAGLDLSFYGGPVQTGAGEYNILVNCNDESCWGGLITTFENDLFGSNMLTILNQYNASGSYSSGGDYPASYDTSGTLQDQDIFNILYTVITTNSLPTGYGSEFHVFLGSGVSQCSQSAGGCYAQQYCAYHGSNDWSDIGHVLYSVEPYQAINGCEVTNQPSPNGVLADSTASVLSHETFETITDPDVAIGNVAWYNQTGGEIGDLCAPAVGVPTDNVVLGADTWEIQTEYSNSVHDCAFAP